MIYKTHVLREPQRVNRGLYPSISQKGSYDYANVIINFLSYADGDNDLIDISNVINTPIKELLNIVNALIQNDLITTM